MDRSILKTGIPAAVVVSVLGFSMLFPAAVSQANGGNHGGDDHGYGNKCGYGQVEDNDEKDNDRHGDTVKTMQKDKHDNDCNEDEHDDEGDSGGGGGGGDWVVANTNLGSVVYVTAVRHFRYPTPR